jgi:hypothetical protein
VRKLPLVERKELLLVLIMGAGDSRLRLFDGFDDGAELLAAAERMGWKAWSRSAGMERIVLKTQAWRANRERLFELQ